jgi:hypothetical protein
VPATQTAIANQTADAVTQTAIASQTAEAATQIAVVTQTAIASQTAEAATQTAAAVATLTQAAAGLDILAAAPNATWSSGAGPLAFGGSDSDNRGFAIYQSQYVLEDGSSPRVLETHPQWTDNGYIRGEFSVPLILSGQHFQSEVSFIKPCCNPPATNGVSIKISFNGNTIYQNIKSYTGRLAAINVDLSAYANQSGTLTLEVGANGNAAQDWLCWINPRIGFPSAADLPGLTAPAQQSPADGSVFNIFPRTTTLVWAPVSGAVKYVAEVDCLLCCGANWCANTGPQGPGSAYGLSGDLTTTSYTFGFVGAQSGRWRVWAVDAANREGPKSAWSGFRYTK